MFLRFGSVALLATALVACSDGGGPGYDGGSGDAGLRSVELSFSTTSPLRVGASAVVPISVLVFDSRLEPVTDSVPIVFGIIGPSYGSSLLTGEVTPDENGIATTLLSTGQQAGQFYIRVATLGATSIGMDVIVDPAAVGSFAVDIAYEGTRTLGETNIVIVPGGDCDTAATLDAQGTPLVTLEAGILGATIDGLPAGGVFAVVARARSALGGFAALGCEDGVYATEGAVTDVSIRLEDPPVFVVSSLSGKIDVSVTALAAYLGEVGKTAMEEHVTSEGGDGAVLYEALEDELRARGETSDADAVAALSTPSAHASLASTLHGQGQGATAVAVAFEQAFSGLAGHLRLSGAFNFPETGQPSFHVESTAFAAGTVVTPITGDALGLDDGTFTLSGQYGVNSAAFLMSPSEIPLACDAVSGVLLDALTASLGTGLYAQLGADLGCDALFAVPDLSSYCTTAPCRADVCERLFSTLLAEAYDAYESASLARAVLVLSGTMELLDTDSDSKIDTTSASDQPALWTSSEGDGSTATTFSLLATSIATP